MPCIQFLEEEPPTGDKGSIRRDLDSHCRFAMLQCYDAVRQYRLPAELRDENGVPGCWRLIDGEWTQS